MICKNCGHRIYRRESGRWEHAIIYLIGMNEACGAVMQESSRPSCGCRNPEPDNGYTGANYTNAGVPHTPVSPSMEVIGKRRAKTTQGVHHAFRWRKHPPGIRRLPTPEKKGI